MSGVAKVIDVIGYAPHGKNDPEIFESYRDFPIGMRFEKEQFDACLHRGVLVPGLLGLYQGRVVRVAGGYGHPQSVEVWVNE
ncbi:hypothetical protein CCP3SC15_1920009 [Gammaproteobacteria bacterium]